MAFADDEVLGAVVSDAQRPPAMMAHETFDLVALVKSVVAIRCNFTGALNAIFHHY